MVRCAIEPRVTEKTFDACGTDQSLDCIRVLRLSTEPVDNSVGKLKITRRINASAFPSGRFVHNVSGLFVMRAL